MTDVDRSNLGRALEVVQHVASAPGPVGVAELAERLGVSRTSAYRLCDALTRIGWIHRLDSGGPGRVRSIELGAQALGFSILVMNKYDQQARLTPTMRELSKTVGETVHAGMLDGEDVVHISRASPDLGPHMALPLGARVPAHVTALGKAILATLPREAILHRYPYEQLVVMTDQSVGTRAALLEELARVASRGYAIDEGESRAGVRCVGAPVLEVQALQSSQSA